MGEGNHSRNLLLRFSRVIGAGRTDLTGNEYMNSWLKEQDLSAIQFVGVCWVFFCLRTFKSHTVLSNFALLLSTKVLT